MKEKLIINANLLRKESEFRTKSCVVEKAIAVSNAEFENLKRHPLCDNKLIAENVDLMYCDGDNNYHCLLVYDEEQGDGLIIESEGTSYSEYCLIQYPERGICLYRCGNERYLLQVIAPSYKEKLFGKAGGR